ncbi:hypothetical protein DYQ86_01430 [Acidobacteria bacterium AB60]|nr:hypothetical protein DYQ86_01430 [Acidobacteria bacterium AB60]
MIERTAVLNRRRVLSRLLLTAVFTLLGFLVMGYHPGIEDDGVYLSAVKSDLAPDLYPHDSDFFRLQLQATLFDRVIAGFVQVTHIPVAWAELTWQLGSLFCILGALYAIANRLFDREKVRWAGVAMVASMLTLPVAGTALSLADQHLHPRNLATAFILLAVSRVLAHRPLQSAPWLMLALLLHPIMAAFGISFCIFLAFLYPVRKLVWPRSWRGALPAAVPLGWIFQPPSATWREALNTRRYYFLFRWTWYEWLGAVGPLLLFWLLYKWAHNRGNLALARFSLCVVVYGIFHQAMALVILTPPSLIRLTPLQPMRYLHLIYLFLVLVAGCLFYKYLFKANVWRWSAFLVLACAGMFAAQRVLYAHSPHLEIPWQNPSNPWLQAFAWVRANTPRDAYFALDPYYLEAPGEDAHGFRALAERSVLADAVKDTAVVTQVPQLGPLWSKQVHATLGWSHFQLGDFQRLRANFGSDWVIVAYPGPGGLDCRWHNESLAVCRVP